MRIATYAAIVALGIGAIYYTARCSADAQQVRCWNAYVTPESYTIQCSNGYWATYRNDGTMVQGHGLVDPNATAPGSTIIIDPTTGGVVSRGGPTVAPPRTLPLDAPHQAPMWGQQPLQTR